MTEPLGLILIVTTAGVVGWLLGRRSVRGRLGAGVAPHLLPDPALDWLRRAHRALGLWITELDPNEEGPRAERIVDAERLSVSQIVAVDRRLERARDQEQSGVERMEAGKLVFHGQAGAAVGVLLPDDFDASGLAGVEVDLRRLLEGMRRKPQIVALTQAQAEEASLESAASVGLRLAYQLERPLDAQVVVAAYENAEEKAAEGHPKTARVRVIGVSGRGDRRLLGTLLPAESELARVAQGSVETFVSAADPLGGVVADRRNRPGSVLLLPMRWDHGPVGAVAIWLTSGREPIGAARAELEEAVRSAAPRIARALLADQHKRQATVDPLTGVHNRHGFEKVLSEVELLKVKEGALIYADIDRFKSLNDALGHPAGDAALVHFARIIREQIRACDVAGRIGGEEFAVWLPETGLELGARIAERIRLKLGTTAWDWRGRNWPLSASFGVASCPETSKSLDNLPAQADAALYVAKNSGRNRVERAGR
jgi:diguanylate cyclase (GGDEF)-like protein